MQKSNTLPVERQSGQPSGTEKPQNIPGNWIKSPILKVESIVEERNHKIAPPVRNNFSGININHNFSWKAGDKIIDGVSSLFGLNRERKRTLSEAIPQLEEKSGKNIIDIISSPTVLLTVYVVCLITYYRTPNKTTRNLALVMSGLLIFNLFLDTAFKMDIVPLYSMWDHLWSTTKKEDSEVEMEEIFEPQGFTFDTPMLSNALIVAISALAGYTVKKSFTTALLAATKVNDTQTTNVAAFLMTMSKCIHDFLVSIKAKDAAKYFEIDAISDDRVTKFQEKVVKFVAFFNSGNPESMLYSMDVYKTLYEEGRQLDALIDKKSFDHKIIFDCVNKLTSTYSKIEELKLSLNGERVEPVGILFKGDAATMKGVLVKRIAAVVAMATMPAEWRPAYKQDNREFFFSVPKDKFWDGYSNKAWITFFDDIFQRKDAVADSESDALKVIDMINSAPFTLPMANINQKNNVFFRSAYVMATSNLANFELLHSVQEPKAVQRRFHIEVDVRISSSYTTNGSFDPAKLPLSVDIEDAKTIPNDFWKISFIEKTGSKISESRKVTVKELIKIIVSRHSQHKKNFFSNRAAEDRLVTDLAEELGYNWADSDILPLEEYETIFEAQGADFDRPRFKLEYQEFIKFLTDKPYYNIAEYDNHYWKMCDRLGRMDLYMSGFTEAMGLFLQEEWDIGEFVSHKEDPFLLMELLKPIYEDSLKRKINPLTKRLEWNARVDTPVPTPIENIRHVFSELLDIIRENPFFTIVAAVGAGIGCWYLAQFLRTLIPTGEGQVEPESVDVKRMGKRHTGPKKTIKLSATRSQIQRMEPQGGIPLEFEFSGLPKFMSTDFGDRNNKNDVLAKIFNKYFYIVYLVDHRELFEGGFETIRYGHATNVVGQLFIIPFHFIFLMDSYRKQEGYKGATVLLVTSTGSTRYSVSLEEFLVSFRTTENASDRDICLVKVESSQRMSKGALKHFLNKKDVDNLMRTTSFSARLVGTYHPNKDLTSLATRNNYFRASMNKGAIMLDAVWEKGSVYNLFDNYMYPASTSKGDCGSLLIAEESNYENRLICGLHVAGGHGHGFSTSLTQESLQDLIEKTFRNEMYFENEEIPDFLKEAPLEIQSGFSPSFILQAPYIPGEVFKSDIKKSKFYRRLPEPFNRVMTMPAKLKPFYDKEGNQIDPLMKAFNKYGKIAPEIDYGMLSRAIESYENLIISADKTTRESRGIIELKLALHSFENVNSISSSTSSGFPMSLPIEEDLKKIYYRAKHEGDESLAEETFQRIAILVESILSKYRQNVRPFWAYKQCGKDETREWFKVLEGKTRLFSASPFLLIVLFRMYFGSFVSSFVEMNIKVGSAVGVNPYSHEWDAIARQLLQFSSNDDEESIAAGDQGEFDTRQWPIIHWGVLDLINRWYGDSDPEANFIRACLFVEITNSRHVFRGKIYVWDTGLPSGNPITAVINTIYNNIVVRMSWEVALLDMKDFNDSVYLIALGDDHAFSVKEEYREIFNEENLPQFMSVLGMKYTTELKGEAVSKFRKLSEIEFLKRGFKKDKKLNRWLAPLRESAIAEMLNWTKKGKEGDQITLDNMVFALREFSLHGRPKFDHWKKFLLDLKNELFPGMMPHGDIPLNFENTYKSVLDLEYYF